MNLYFLSHFMFLSINFTLFLENCKCRHCVCKDTRRMWDSRDSRVTNVYTFKSVRSRYPVLATNTNIFSHEGNVSRKPKAERKLLTQRCKGEMK